MNITFLIGNGFDVGMGLNSKFKDFFPIYQANSKNKEDRIKQLSIEIGEDYDTWADFEAALGRYTLKFSKETMQDYIDQIKDFETEFINYLNEQEKRLSFNDEKKISRVMIDSLTMFYSNNNLAPISNTTINKTFSNNISQDHTYNFVNYNYTSVLEKCLETIPNNIVKKRKIGAMEYFDKIGKIIHVHGSSGMYPIIGLNDVTQIDNSELANDAKFLKYSIKPNLNRYLRQGNDDNATEIINNSRIICLYGMSLGKTDKKWWNKVLNWLHGDSTRQLVIFDYDEKYNASTPYTWLEKEEYYLNRLSGYNENPAVNVEKLLPRIHIAIHKNIFQMDLVKENRNVADEAIEKLVSA